MKLSVARLTAIMLGVGLVTVLALAASDEWKAPARASRKPNPVPVDAKSLEAGKAAYLKECNACHGPGGKGDGAAAASLEKPPGDLSKPTMWDQTDGALYYKITEGRKPMPSFEKLLTDEQRWQVINYVRTLAPKPAGK
jgi:mono/diheme cytochrome c family protein